MSPFKYLEVIVVLIFLYSKMSSVILLNGIFLQIDPTTILNTDIVINIKYF